MQNRAVYRGGLSVSVSVALICVVVLLLSLAGSVRAQALPNTAIPVWTPSMVGSTYTFNGASATSANAAMLSFGNAANGPLYAEATQSLALGGGRTASVVVRAAPVMSAVAKSVGGFLANPLVGALVTGVALYDLAKELGYGVDNSAGSVVVTRQDPLVCTVAPCTQYKSNVAGWGWGYGSTPLGAGVAAAVVATAADPSFRFVATSVLGAVVVVTAYRKSNGTFYNTTSYSYYANGSIAPDPSGVLPSTSQELQDAIASKSGWPSSSALPRAVADAVKSGQPLALPAPYSITGPSSVPGAPSVQVNPDGSKVTTTTDKTLTYSPPSVVIGDTRTVTNTDPSGATSPGPVTTAPVEFKSCGLPGEPMCKIDESGTPTDSPITDAVINAGTDAVKSAQETLRTKVVGDSDKNWSWTFVGAPPLVQCEAIPMPVVVGKQIPSIDPCQSVDGIRAFMAWIWAFVGFYICIGLVREVL